ncbi:MAG: hypothetical protein RLZZ127_3358 [Planctomycetota bacterium]|jgi:hypothetical protein
MRALSALLLLALLAVAPLAAGDAAKATITNGSREFPALILREDLDGVEFTDPEGKVKSSLRRGQYTIVYDEVLDRNLSQARTHAAAGRWAEAGTAYSQAAATLRVDWAAEEACLQGAEAFLRANQPDQALSLLDRLERTWPKTLRLAASRGLRGTALAAKKDPGARKAFEDIIAREREWGPAAALAGARGLAGLARAENKPAEAAAALKPVVERLAPGSDPLWSTAALEFAGDLLAAGQGDAAAATYRRIATAEVDDAVRAAARLGWGRTLAAKGDLASMQAAVDQLAIAAVLPGADAPTQAAAGREAKALCDRLSKDAGVSADDQREYRLLMGKF